MKTQNWLLSKGIFICLRVKIFYKYIFFIDIIKIVWFIEMYYFSSFAIGGFVPSAAIAGVLLLIGLGAFFYLGIKGPTDY